MKVWEPLVCCHCQCGSIKPSAVLVGKHVWCPAGVTIIQSREVLRLYRVVVRSRAQIIKPDAVFVVFLGIKWAHDIVEKNRS